MSLVGSLEDLGLGDILQIVSLSRKSGVLNLSWGEVRGKIIFKDGQVVAAANTELPHNLGLMVIDRHLAGQNLVVEAATEAERTGGGHHLKTLLVDKHGVDRRAVEEIIKDQIEETVFSFFSWPEGTFNFELMESLQNEAEILGQRAREFILDAGLSPQYLAMEGTRLQDERRRIPPVGPPSAPPAVLPTSIPLTPRAAEKEKTAGPPEAKADTPAPEPEEDFSSVADAVTFYQKKPPAPAQVQSARETTPAAACPPEPPAAAPPRPEPAGVSEEVMEVTAAAPIKPAAKDQGLRVLVADDDPLLLDLLQKYLSANNIPLETFDNISSALARFKDLALREISPVMIADLLMPNEDFSTTLGGLELFEKVHAVDPQVRFVMMTDYENKVAEQKSREMGIKFYFYKPKSSQLDPDTPTPEFLNFTQVLQNALEAFREKPGKAPAAPPEAKAERPMLINLGDELRKEFSDGNEFITKTAAAEQGQLPSRGLAMLKSMINELNDPSSEGQITLLILRFASEMMNRAIIFLVARNQIAGLGQFGIEVNGKDPEKHVRRIRIPLNEPSIFRETIIKRMALKKKLKLNKWNKYLVDILGGKEPAEVFVAPLITGGKIAAILYGDNVPEERDIGDTESLEIFLSQAGLAMEKALLERRLQDKRSAHSEAAGQAAQK